MSEALLSSLVARPTLYQRNEISYLVARNWRSDAKREAVRHLRAAKASSCCETCASAVDDVSNLLRRLFGCLNGTAITAIPCGHSRRPDCLGRRLAEAVAARLGVRFVQCWKDRFVSGVSHPKEFAKLPPLEWVEVPTEPVIVVDDVATSGWHMEEALSSLRGAGVQAFGIAWIGGTVGAGRNSGEPEATGSVFGEGGGGQSSPWGRGGQWGVPR